MGLYINTGNDGFRAARNGEYIDKSDLIEIVNNSLNSERQFSIRSVPTYEGMDVEFPAKQENVALHLMNLLEVETLLMREIQARLNVGNRTRFKQKNNGPADKE